MAQFSQWALQYVLSDDEPAQLEITQKAAREIEASRASSTVVGNWAASVQQWMTPGFARDDDQVEDGDEGVSGDIIARAKALSFLADTLETLDRNTLKSDQVLRLIGFFGAMFSYDHKAGITASAKALRQLCAMKSFKPDMGVRVIDDVCKIREDFRLQTAATRLEIYELLLALIQDPSVSSELQHKYGASCGFAVELLQLCQHERDPRNLMIWFKILAILVKDYDPSPEVTEEIFKAFSAYFPISLRSSTTPIGITAEDLKEAVRGCFASHHRLATFTFPFLISKLDQGDAVTVAVKVDILKTIKACIEEYENPQASIVPHTEKIWNSLKYEVRNGEVKETIDATLEVLRAISRKLDGTKTHKLDVALLKSYIDLVFRDCRDDLANPTYTKQAGLLIMTVIGANIRGYVLYNAGLIDTIRQNLRQPKSPSHKRDLLLLLNSTLKTRMELSKQRKQGHPEDEETLRSESRAHLETLFHDAYLPIWAGKSKEMIAEESDVLKQVIQGFALLVSQQVLQSDGQAALLYPTPTCSEICSLLSLTLTNGLALSSNDSNAGEPDLEDEAVLALRNIVMSYRYGYEEISGRVTAEIRKRDWASPSAYSLNALKDLLSRFTFIGCSEIPSKIATNPPSQQPFSPLQHFLTLTASLLELFPLSSRLSTPHSTGNLEEGLANAHIVSSLHASLLWFLEACEAKYGREALASYSSSDQNWLEQFQHLPDDWLIQIRRGDADLLGTLVSLQQDDPEVYRQFLKLSLFNVRYLFRAASAGSRQTWSERALALLSQMSALVVRSLSEELQVSCNLAHEAFNFFAGPAEDSKRSASDIQTGILTVGILQGLRPRALAGLYQGVGVAEKHMCDTSGFGTSPSQESSVRAAIGVILANKYQGVSDPETSMMKRVLDFWANWYTEATASAPINSEAFSFHNTVAMNVIAGAVARQDRNVISVIPALQRAAASQHANGEIVARSMGILLQHNNLLTQENHAVVKRFYKQWAYSHLAKPLYEDALPGGKDNHTANRYRVVILSVVSNCPFTVYQDDLEPLIRLLVTALSDRGALSEGVSWTQVTSALQILVEILTNEPDALKGHLREIIGRTTKVYEECCQKKAGLAATLATCRNLALQVLGAIPTKFEERYTLPHAPPMQRMLAVACGDPVRKVREVARKARSNWAKVV